MRILIVTIEYPPIGGGASPMIHEIAKQYVRLGHKTSVITMPFHDLPASEIMDGVQIYRVPCLRSRKHISYLWEHISFIFAAKTFLKNHLSANQYDVCHAHFMVPTGIVARWIWKQYHIPYIITSQGSDIPGYNPDRFGLVHRFTPGLIRSIIHHSSYIVAPSKYLQSLIVKVIGNHPEKLLQIPSGIDTDKYVSGNKKPMLLSTGRILPRKGFQYLIEAVSDEPFPYEIHICGDGPMLKELKLAASKSATPIVFHGWLDNDSDAYISLLSKSSIFCLVSAKENASTSLMEGLSAGCAVITSNVSGCPESVGDAGICIPPANVPALRSVLKKLVEDDELRSSLMKKGRARAIQEFDWKSIAMRYLDLFSQIRST